MIKDAPYPFLYSGVINDFTLCFRDLFGITADPHRPEFEYELSHSTIGQIHNDSGFTTVVRII